MNIIVGVSTTDGKNWEQVEVEVDQPDIREALAIAPAIAMGPLAEALEVSPLRLAALNAVYMTDVIMQLTEQMGEGKNEDDR